MGLILRRVPSSSKTTWFLTISGLTIVGTLASVLRELMFPLVYARYILASLLIIYLPGSCLVRALFPTREVFSVEQIALSMVISIAEVSILGLVLNYTHWGITQTSMSLGLLVLTLTSAIVALVRK